ncbi:cytoglobin-2-like [Pocillopora verrucosa]|uniref:cytoglobin-2-like n=1 Tax=Pocillopora verrucosa TaxID=203993 RepID=UPI002797C9CE|nr:cytoglobin-2-like [Pocillopora verrucosa]
MGCTNSRRIGNTLILHPQFKSIENIVIPLTDEQIKILRETWEIIEPTKKEIGVNVYIRFLKMNPDIKSRFTEFKEISIDEINKSNGHPRRLMAAIENSIGSLDDPETFAGYVLELGRRHIRLRSKPTKSHFIDLRKAFIGSIKEPLTTNWRPEVEESWVLLFDFMTAVMMKGLSSTS